MTRSVRLPDGSIDPNPTRNRTFILTEAGRRVHQKAAGGADTSVSDYRHTIGVAPDFEKIRATVAHRGKVYFIEVHRACGKGVSTIIKRQDFRSAVNPTVRPDTPTGQSVLARFRRFCNERNLTSGLR